MSSSLVALAPTDAEDSNQDDDMTEYFDVFRVGEPMFDLHGT